MFGYFLDLTYSRGVELFWFARRLRNIRTIKGGGDNKLQSFVFHYSTRTGQADSLGIKEL